MKPEDRGKKSPDKSKYVRIKPNPPNMNLLGTEWICHSECFWLQVTISQITLSYTIRNFYYLTELEVQR